MLRNLRHRNVKKGRKYPIKRDERGRSARSRAFRAFDRGKMPAEVAALVGISRRTAYRYRSDWNKLPPNLEDRYAFAKWSSGKDSRSREEAISLIAEAHEMSQEEVVRRLEQPWGLKQLIMRKWPNPIKDRGRRLREARLDVAMTFLYFLENRDMSDDEILSWVRDGREALRRAREEVSGGLSSSPGGHQPERGARNPPKRRVK